jgi:hypothetical protein
MKYVDKTHLIRDVLDRGAEVLVLPSSRCVYPSRRASSSSTAGNRLRTSGDLSGS